jgi:hypothetical protein
VRTPSIYRVRRLCASEGLVRFCETLRGQNVTLRTTNRTR